MDKSSAELITVASSHPSCDRREGFHQPYHANSTNIYPIRNTARRQVIYSMGSISPSCPMLNRGSRYYAVTIFVIWER